jgi:hypothetical protein
MNVNIVKIDSSLSAFFSAKEHAPVLYRTCTDYVHSVYRLARIHRIDYHAHAIPPLFLKFYMVTPCGFA